MPQFTNSVTGTDNAIVGVAEKGIGAHGTSKTSTGAGGVSDSGVGVHGVSKSGPGVRGDAEIGVGIFGNCEAGDGVKGHGRRGVVGESETFQGVFGKSRDNAGVVGESDRLHGVFGICHNPNGGGIFGHNDAGGFAGIFDGRVSVQGDVDLTGDIRLTNADGAELFDTACETPIAPGSVVVVDDRGAIQPAVGEYDTRVVGVVSGAGSYRPALLLDHRPDDAQRLPVAVFGKVYCQVDATAEPISTGDLLCSSRTEGHAMRASDSAKAFGAVIGKALAPIAGRMGLIPVLVALQ